MRLQQYKDGAHLFLLPASKSPSTVELIVPSAPSTRDSQVLETSHSAPRCFLFFDRVPCPAPRIDSSGPSSEISSIYSSSESAMSDRQKRLNRDVLMSIDLGPAVGDLPKSYCTTGPKLPESENFPVSCSVRPFFSPGQNQTLTATFVNRRTRRSIVTDVGWRRFAEMLRCVLEKRVWRVLPVVGA